jgi:Na+/H+ antiporter NhaC
LKLDQAQETLPRIEFHGGAFGALLPFFIFITGVISIALSGAPDEKGFWPVLVLALAVGLLLSKDKTTFSETVIVGMSQKIVMIMITAWLLASILGKLMLATGFVDALIWLSVQFDLGGTGFVVVAFMICCIVSLSTGSSFATILICGPLLYPTGALLGADLAVLAGAILGGATFGDFIAPISDTTIASALSQDAEIGDTVRSRIKYVLPAFCFALLAYLWFAWVGANDNMNGTPVATGDPRGLPMMLVPVFVIYLFLTGKHLFHGLLMGLCFGTVFGLVMGLLPLDSVLKLDLDNYVAKSFIIDGISRALGLSVFTILLMGLVATLKASGLLDRLVDLAAKRSSTNKQGEGWIAAVMSLAVLFTTHSIVAILMVTDFSKKTGERLGINSIRRANLLSLIACIFPFLLPYFIPVILMANVTNTGAEYGFAQVSPIAIGFNNFMSWGLLLVALITLLLGWGRAERKTQHE